MDYKLAVLLVVLAAWSATAAEEKSPFREGTEYQYDFEAAVSTGSTVSDDFSSATHLKGSLMILSKADGSNTRVNFKFKDVTIGLQHGDLRDAAPLNYTKNSDLDKELESPFQVLYTGSKITAAWIPDKDTVWAANFKRAIASLLQFRLISDGNNQVYNDEELTLNGKCHVNYYSNLDDDQFTLQKEHDMSTCLHLGRWRTFINSPRCSAMSPNQAEVVTTSKSTWYTITPNRGYPEMTQVRSYGKIWLDPFGMPKTAMKTAATITMVLSKTKRASSSANQEAFGKAVEMKDPLEFVFGHPFDKDASRIDLKAAQNLLLHAKPLLMSQEQLRRKCMLDLFASLDVLDNDGSGARSDLDRVSPSVISHQLGSLDYINVRALYRELTVTTGNEKLESARQIFLDLLLHSGSNAGIIFLRDLIREDKLEEFEASRLIAYAGVFVRHPTEKLIDEFQSLMEAKVSKENYGLIRNAAPLAVAKMVARTCSIDSPGSTLCASALVQKWQKKFLDKLVGATTFAERALYVHTLHNIGYGSGLNRIIQMITNKDTDKDASNLRVYMIRGLAPYLKQEKVANLLLQLLRNQATEYLSRVAAASVLMDDPSADTLKHVRNILANEKNMQVKQFIASCLQNIVKTYNPCFNDLKSMARQILNMMDFEPIREKYSAEYAFDFFEESSQFGSQLNLKVIAGEFDDMPSFVYGKSVYYLKSAAYQPFSWSFRMSNMRKYVMTLLSATLRNEDLNLARTRRLLEQFQFAARQQQDMSADVTFTLHGSVVMFYHFDPSFFQKAILTMNSLENIQDWHSNAQRSASAGAMVFTQPNALGFPVTSAFSAPIMISTKGRIIKLRTSATFARKVNMNIYGQVHMENGIGVHVATFNLNQVVMRQRKAFFNIPVNIELSADVKKLQFDFNYLIPNETNALELNSNVRTILVQKGPESSADFIGKMCPQCANLVVIRKPSVQLKTLTIVNSTSVILGMESHARLYDCEPDRSKGRQLEIILSALNPATMNYGSTASWAYLAFLRVQHHMFLTPEGQQCGYQARTLETSLFPVKEVVSRIKLKLNYNEEPEVSWETGKIAIKVETTLKGPASTSTDRKGEIDMTYEYKSAGAKNNANVRVVVLANRKLDMKDFMICMKAESNFEPMPTEEYLDISGYTRPPVAQGSVEFIMGDTTQVNQCPTDQFRFKLGIKASAGDWVMERRTNSTAWPYKECEAQRNSPNWANGIVPQTEACYRTAIDFTTLSNYQFDMRAAGVPKQMQTLLSKLSSFFSVSLLPYSSSNVEELATVSKELGHFLFNISFRPHETDRQMVDVYGIANNVIERYDKIELPAKLRLGLPSTSIPQTTRIAYESQSLPSCLATLQTVSTFDNVTYANSFMSCYSLLTSDCGAEPTFAVFTRKTTGLYSLAVQVHVGGHMIEIVPDESGRRRHFSVKANDVEVDVSSRSHSLPEGRDKFYVLKVRYQAPIYIISSPGAGLLIHYSGSHVAVFPTWIHRSQLCGMCGNFDTEPSNEFINPAGCTVSNAQLLASYTMGTSCFSESEKTSCPKGKGKN